MKKVIKKKLEETKQHAFGKKVLQREKAKGAPRVGEFYKENDILLEDIDLGQIRIDMKREGEDITTEEIIETTKIIALKDHMIGSPLDKKKAYYLWRRFYWRRCQDKRKSMPLSCTTIWCGCCLNIVWHLKLHIQERNKRWRSLG